MSRKIRYTNIVITGSGSRDYTKWNDNSKSIWDNYWMVLSGSIRNYWNKWVGACSSNNTPPVINHRGTRRYNYVSSSVLLKSGLTIVVLIFSLWMSLTRIYTETLQLRCWEIVNTTNQKQTSTSFQSHQQRYPRIVSYVPDREQYYNNIKNHNYNSSTIYKYQYTYKRISIDPTIERYPSKRIVDYLGNNKFQKAIEYDDDFYKNSYTNCDITDDCQFRYKWQKVSTIPTCNTIHEYDLSIPFRTIISKKRKKKVFPKLKKQYTMLAEGFWSSVFLMNQDELYNNIYRANRTGNLNTGNTLTSSSSQQTMSPSPFFILKTMRYRQEFTPRNFDRMRRDALIMEHLSSSPFVIDIYGFCGTSSFSEFGDGNDLASAIWPPRIIPKNNQQSNSIFTSENNNNNNTKTTSLQQQQLFGESPALTQLEKLQIATQISIGLADLHNIDSEGEASIAHTDISPNQYIQVNGIYKLNDFNRARFIPWSSTNNTACSYRIGNNPGKNRAPEEYKLHPQSEKVDIYSLGNIFYMLLQGEYPFDDVDADEARKLVIAGHRPTFYIDIWNSTDPVNVALKHIMIQCHEQNPEDRPSARQVEQYLKGILRQLDPGRLEQWGLK